MKTQKQIKNFILKTLLPYKEDKTRCATNGSLGCLYLTNDGKKCAVGRWMKKGVWQKNSGYADELFRHHAQEQVLLKAALDMNFTSSHWSEIQKYHDNIAFNNTELVNNTVKKLEEYFSIELPELIITT